MHHNISATYFHSNRKERADSSYKGLSGLFLYILISNPSYLKRFSKKCIKDKNLIEEIKRISASGKNAEVKRAKDGQWVVYEVEKKRKTL